MSGSAIANGPFQLAPSAHPFFRGSLGGFVRGALERLLAFPALNSLHADIAGRGAERPFCERSIESLGVRIDVDEADFARIPRSGPLIVVSNHPYGGLDGIVLGALLQRVRPDVRLFANYLLRMIPEMHDVSIFVDPFGGVEATSRNLRGTRAAIRWVRDGGVLGVFPAGEVSHLTLQRRTVTDPPWSHTVARLVAATGAAVMPIFFHGENSKLFQAAGLIHPRLRTMLLPRELLRRRQQPVRIEIGSVIPNERLARVLDNASKAGDSRDHGVAEVTEYLRVRTYILRGRAEPASAIAGASGRGASMTAAPPQPDEPIVPALPAAEVEAEIAGLPAEQCLAQSGELHAWIGTAAELPRVMRELGRLREKTFRLVGEGTGKAIDLDRFDQHYLHLFIWHRTQRKIAGAYRLGPTDEILRRDGVRGLYTSTLFDYQPRLLEQIGPALEMGRSFIVPEFQRDYTPLLLLWKGIGEFLVRNPRYRRLFGPVSVSDEFHTMTKQLLMTFLRAHSFDDGLAALVAPRNPPRTIPFRDADPRRLATLVQDMSDVEELVREIESNRRSVPVLLRQYLRLNAKLLGFNIDPQFGDVLDGLVLVDVPAMDRPLLNRYLGRDGAAAYLTYHGIDPTRAPGV